METNWSNNSGDRFRVKADAFKWINEANVDTDPLKLYCDGELRFEKFAWGLYDTVQQSYIIGNLPVEYYN